MKKIRTAFGALLFVFVIGGVQGCADSPIAPSDPVADDRECYWVDGVLHCVG